jgi:formamidopyrimidine-DNA glycosylase
MPELPEVETVKRGLDPLLRGRSISDADIMDGRLTAPASPASAAAASTCSSASIPAARSSSTCA